MLINSIGRIGITGQPVFQYKCSNTSFTEPTGNIITFMINPQLTMSASGCNDDGSTVCFFFSRQVRSNGRVMNIRNNMLTFVESYFLFTGLRRTRCAIGPKEYFLLLCKSGDREQ